MVYSFEALGTKWWITLYEEPGTADVIFNDIGRFVSTFEARYSRFKPDSLITILNRERVIVHPDEEYRALLHHGKQLYLRTKTNFNILTGHILEARGYNAEYSFIDSGERPAPGNPITDLLISNGQIELLHGNVDVGGYGKGYLIDLVAEQLKTKHQQKYFLVNGGGDMYATSNYEKPIEIYLAHPTSHKTSIGKTSLFNQGFAASSPHIRKWKAYDGETNHIIGSISVDGVYVKAKQAVDADAFATTLLLLDEAGQEQLSQQENLGIAKYILNASHLTTNQLFHQNSCKNGTT